MLKSQRNFIPAKLHTGRGDVTKDWYAYYSVRNPLTDEMKRFKNRGQINYIHSKRERTSAGNALVESINELLKEGWTPFEKMQPKLTLVELFEKELDLKKNQFETGVLRNKTYLAYRHISGLFTAWMKKNRLEHLEPKQFTSNHAHEFCEYMIKEKRYGGKTFNARKNFTSMFFNSFVRRELVTSNPFLKFKPLPETPARHIPYSRQQTKDIDKILMRKHYEFYCFKCFIYFCLARISEIRHLQIKDMDFRNWTVIIYGDIGKTKVQRMATIPIPLRKIIRGMNLKKYPDDFYIFGKGLKPGPKPSSYNNINYLFRKLIKKPLGLSKDNTLYAFKHTGNIRAYDLGIDIRDIQRQNGHTTEGQTRTYLRSMGREPNKEFALKMK